MKHSTTAKIIDSKIYGQALEEGTKYALERKNAEGLSPAGVCDFVYHHKHYDVKQNGSPIKYGDNAFIKGSSRVIYASHIVYKVINQDAENITIQVDFDATEFFILDKVAFVEFLLSNGYAKRNDSRHQINIQTVYNYKKGAYHGSKGKAIEAWAKAHEVEDAEAIRQAIRDGARA
jgi:hypothetical protein